MSIQLKPTALALPLAALCAVLGAGPGGNALAAQARPSDLLAGAAKVDVTDRDAGPVNDPLYVKALVFRKGAESVALVTVDAVSLGEIGRIGNDYLPKVRRELAGQPGIPGDRVVINASHCHGLVRSDVVDLTVRAVREAWSRAVPVRVGTGREVEDRIQINRRLRLKDGSEADVRRAYSLPPDREVASVGPIDPEVGVLRVDRLDGRPLAVAYNFACHPIEGTPSGGNTADFPGFASRAVEESLGEGVVALFLQGCAGDINPILYKQAVRPRDAEPLGNLLGLRVLRAVRGIATRPDPRLAVVSDRLALPRGADLEARIAAAEAERARLVETLAGTNLNLKSFIPLLLQQRLDPDFAAYHADQYLHERALGRPGHRKLDEENRADVEAYRRNVETMERITRLNTNLGLLRMHLRKSRAAASPTVEAEIHALRIGDFVLLTFPGELTVQVGLNLKRRSPHHGTLVAGYTNGYLYYAPTAEQRRNTGYAQEDCDCLLAPEWQALFETRALALLSRL